MTSVSWDEGEPGAGVGQEALPAQAAEGEGERVADGGQGVDPRIDLSELGQDLGELDVREAEEGEQDGDPQQEGEAGLDVEEAPSEVDGA